MRPARVRPARAPNPGDPRTDAELLGAAHGGDREALGTLFDRHAQSVYAFARRFVGTSDAEDVVQTTFLRVLAIAGSYDDRALSARSWLFGVAYQVVRERRRASERLRAAMARYATVAASFVRPGASDLDLEAALASLSEPKRVVLVLTQVHGLSAEEVARALDLPIGTVWTRLHHAKRDLRHRLGGAA